MRRAIPALAKLGEAAVIPLGRVMHAWDLDTRMAATQALVLIGEPAIETLCLLLGGKSPNAHRKPGFAGFASDSLPIAAEAGHEIPPPVNRTWWSRFTCRFRGRH